MRVVILPDPQSVSRYAAGDIAELVRKKPNAVLGLATGGTPTGTYRELVRMHREEGLDFSNVQSFNLDEYVGIQADDPHSYRTFMNETFFQHINIDLGKTQVPLASQDPCAECLRYEQDIQHAGGIDLQLLGIGTDGHIGFNEPGSSLASRTRIKTLAPQTRRDNARFFGSVDEVPVCAITMGVGTILEAKSILLLATGLAKSDAIRKCIEGPLSAMVTASALQMHPQVTVVLDQPAASELTLREYYQWSEATRQKMAK